jgi:hypothetical protein
VIAGTATAAIDRLELEAKALQERGQLAEAARAWAARVRARSEIARASEAAAKVELERRYGTCPVPRSR